MLHSVKGEKNTVEPQSRLAPQPHDHEGIADEKRCACVCVLCVLLRKVELSHTRNLKMA